GRQRRRGSDVDDAQEDARAAPDRDRQAMPPGMAVLWGLRPEPTRGPKPGLSVERIVRAAIGIADADGLGAVSMSRVARALGLTTMSLYRYVDSMDELRALMLGAGAGYPPEPQLAAGWRAELTRWSREQLVIFVRHPWMGHVPVSGPPLSPTS